jgi:hypothetical protein
MKNRRVAHSVSADRFRRTPPPASLRVRDPVDLLGAVPFLLGYHPANSVVVVGVHRQIHLMTARYDLPPPDADPEEYLRGRFPDPAQLLRRQGVSGVLLVGYGEAQRVAPAMECLHRIYRLAGFTVLDALHVQDGRFRSALCADPDCCPAEGFPFEPRDTRVAAECTVAGWVALPDREAYEAQLRPVGGAARRAMRQAAIAADERLYAILTHPPSEGTAERRVLAEGRTAIVDAEQRYRQGQGLSNDEVAWLAVLLKVIPVRDLAWSRITGSEEHIAHLRALWLDVLRRCQPDVSVAPLCLFAFATWRGGDGTLARLALEAALDLDPDYTMASNVLYPMILAGIPPSTMRGFPWPVFRRRPGSRPRRRSTSSRGESRRE